VLGHSAHRAIAYLRLELEPVEAEHVKRVSAEHFHHVDTETSSAKARPERNANVGAAVVDVDRPKYGLTDKFPVLEFNDGERGELLARF